MGMEILHCMAFISTYCTYLWSDGRVNIRLLRHLVTRLVQYSIIRSGITNCTLRYCKSFCADIEACAVCRHLFENISKNNNSDSVYSVVVMILSLCEFIQLI